MKKVLSVIISIIMILLMCSCQQSTDINTKKYHSNKTINELINNFNKVALENIEITQEMVSKGAYNNNANVSVNGVWVTIYDSSNGLFVDYQLEASDDTSILPLFYGFVKATNSNIADDEISSVWNELQTNNYQNYDYYNFDKFQCTYSKQKLNDGNYRYTVKTGYKNK